MLGLKGHYFTNYVVHLSREHEAILDSAIDFVPLPSRGNWTLEGGMLDLIFRTVTFIALNTGWAKMASFAAKTVKYAAFFFL